MAPDEAEAAGQAESMRLEDLRLEALEERAEAELALGHHRELVPELQALVAEYPLRERLRGQLMLALHRSGWRADARRVYQEFRRLLAEELDLEPGPELRLLAEELRAG